MKDEKIYRCPKCSCEFYYKNARSGKSVGSPMIACPGCGEQLFRSSILEPAIISSDRYFNIKYSTLYGRLRIGVILIYAVFLFFILTKRTLALSLYFVGFALLIYVAYEVIRLVHLHATVNSPDYERDVAESLVRLEDPKYAAMVINAQGIDKKSVFYYRIHGENETNGGEDNK